MFKSFAAVLALGSATLAWAASPAPLDTSAPALGPSPAQWSAAQAAAKRVAEEMARACPLADVGDQAAFEACRKGLYADPTLRMVLNDVVLWGRQRDPKIRIADANLTQFAPDVLTGLYLPLFMFNGEHSVHYVASEKLFQIRLRTAFRNRLQPGQFPYPFWHEEEKWAMYQDARDVLLWWDPKRERVKVAQYTVHGSQPPLVATTRVAAPSFDGRWMWTDAQGRSQPKVTLFDGLFAPANPYLPKMEAAYKALALRLREGQCDQCHVPNNPDKSKRLVLLQTPAHAAGEIERLLKSVREDRMPRDEAGIENPLDAHTKGTLLKDGEAFALLVQAAKQWEARSRQPNTAQADAARR